MREDISVVAACISWSRWLTTETYHFSQMHAQSLNYLHDHVHIFEINICYVNIMRIYINNFFSFLILCDYERENLL
jgi:hypothetical protein